MVEKESRTFLLVAAAAAAAAAASSSAVAAAHRAESRERVSHQGRREVHLVQKGLSFSLSLSFSKLLLPLLLVVVRSRRAGRTSAGPKRATRPRSSAGRR